MIHEDLECPVAARRKKRRSGRRSATGSLVRSPRSSALVSETRVPSTGVRPDPHSRRESVHALVGGIEEKASPPRGGVERSRHSARPLTCPCCSAVPPLLDCSPWTDSCCCIHSSVSLQEDGRNEAMKIVCYIAPDRSAKFLVGNGGPVKFFRRRDVNAIQRGAVYILRNAYEIALYGEYRKT